MFSPMRRYAAVFFHRFLSMRSRPAGIEGSDQSPSRIRSQRLPAVIARVTVDGCHGLAASGLIRSIAASNVTGYRDKIA